MNYRTRVALAIGEGILTAKHGGMKVAARVLMRRIYRTSELLLFGKDGPFPMPELPAAARVDAIHPQEAQSKRGEVLAAGAETDVLNFQRGAVCYIVHISGVPAGLGWRFPESRLLRRLGLAREGVYLGGFSVRNEYRGRGLYPLLLQVICHKSLGPNQVAYAETLEENRASIRGLEKAGFRLQGRVRLTSIAGLIVRCRLTSS